MRKTRPGRPVLASHTPAPDQSSAAVKISRGGRPTKNESEELGSRILKAAAELFAKQGFAATTMEQVAMVCGVGKDTLYRRYPSKPDLFAALMRGLQAALIPELDRILDVEAEPLEKLRQYARSLLSINLRPELLALSRVALGEAMAFGGVKPISTREDAIMTRFATLVANVQRIQFFTGEDPYFIAEQLLYATSVKPKIAAMLGDTGYFETKAQDEYFKQAWTLFLAGATPRDATHLPMPE